MARGDQRERNENKGAEAALPEGPAVQGEVVGAADAFHEGCDDAGCSGDADDDGDDEKAGGTGLMGRSRIEVALQDWADVGGEDAVEEGGELGADGSGVGSKPMTAAATMSAGKSETIAE